MIWLHGLGADGYDFVPVVRELQALGAPAARYVFPHAATMPVTINGGAVMRAWYDIVNTDLLRREDEKGIRASQQQVEALIAREAERGVARSRIVLAGFSQGGAIALQTGLRQPQPLAAIIALSCYLPLADSFARERALGECRRADLHGARHVGSDRAARARRRFARCAKSGRLQRRVASVSDAALGQRTGDPRYRRVSEASSALTLVDAQAPWTKGHHHQQAPDQRQILHEVESAASFSALRVLAQKL